jgi:hypothetical protein
MWVTGEQITIIYIFVPEVTLNEASFRLFRDISVLIAARQFLFRAKLKPGGILG